MQTPIVGVELLILFMKKALAQTIINPNDIISIQSVKGNLILEKGMPNLTKKTKQFGKMSTNERNRCDEWR